MSAPILYREQRYTENLYREGEKPRLSSYFVCFHKAFFFPFPHWKLMLAKREKVSR